METYYQPDLGSGSLYLLEEESKHCLKVLRRQVGDRIIVVDGSGLRVEAEITEANPKKCRFSLLSETRETKPGFENHIAIAPTKNQDRLEWFIEKSVELGVQVIDLYFSKHSERRKVNMERLMKKALAAMKQSGQSYLPVINSYNDYSSLIKAKNHIEDRYIAYVDFDNPVLLFDLARKNTTSLVLIGPEGDFSADELKLALDSGYRKVSLGNNRLRTETAGLAACHILNLVNR